MTQHKVVVTKSARKVAPRTKPPPVRIPNEVQPSLQVGAVHDPAEREAEAMAARVVASAAPADAPLPEIRPNQAQPLRRAAEDQPNLDTLTEPAVPTEQADVDVGAQEDVATQGIGGADVAELEGGTPEDTSGEAPAGEAPPIPDAPFPIMEMRRADTGAVVGRSGGAAPTDVSSLVAHPGPGRPLPKSLRARVEPHFGTSFADVRLHDSPADRRAATRIGARAFTHKNRIWLGPGESETNTRLMAHELTHVVQQTRGAQTLPINRKATLPTPADPVVRRGYFADKAESVARHVPGYTLLTVLVGRKFISGKRVSMNAENLIEGFLGLIPGGTLIFDRLKETRVLQDAFDFAKGKLGELNLTWDRIKSDLSRALDTLNPFTAADNVKDMVVGLIRDVTRFVGALAKKFLEFIVRGALKLAGRFGDKVWGVLQRAGDTLALIVEDPLGFAKNLAKSVIGGFKQFGSNILTHLKKGLLGWLFGSLASAGIELPAKLDFKGLMSLVLQILGITYANFRKRLVKQLGPKGEKMVSMMETSVDVVKTLLKEGFLGIWQKLLDMIDSFRQTLIGGMTEMVITSLARAGISWLSGLSNPVGAIIKICLMIYDLIVAFLERLEQIADVANSIFASMAEIAKGQVQRAANFIEETIGRTVPLVIAFVAALVPVSGITKKIKAVIKKLQDPVKKAMDKMITFVRKKAKKLFSKLIGKVNGKRKFPSFNFKIGAKQHRIFAEKGKGGKVTVKMASENQEEITKKQAAQSAEIEKIKKVDDPKAAEALRIAKAIQKQTEDADAETAKEAKRIKGDSTKENQLAKIKQLEKELKEAARELEAAAKSIDANPVISSQSEDGLFRAAEPRLEGLEGKQGAHGALLEWSKKNFNKEVKQPITNFYEMDHTIEKRFAKAVLENLHLIDPKEAKKRLQKEVVKGEQRADRAGQYNAALQKKKEAGETKLGRQAGQKTAVKDEGAPPLGKIGIGEFKTIPETAPAFPAVAVYRHNHVPNKGLKDHTAMIESARTSKDPHGEVKKTLRAQMDLETTAMTKKLDADANASPKIKANVKAGIDAAKAEVTDIFGLKDVEPRSVPDEEVNAQKNDPSSRDLLFEGGNGAPNFLEIEGVGGQYGGLPSSKHLERDHIIDKSYPKTAKALPLLSEAERARFEDVLKAELAAGGTKRRMSAARKARKEALMTATLFPAGGAMSRYTDANGYAIPFYKPLANRVTSATGRSASASQMSGAAGGADLASLAHWVIEGTGAGLEAAQDTKQGRLKGLFLDRTLTHSAHVAEQYSQDTGEISKNQASPEQEAIAKRHMTRIKGQVAASLREARSQTDQLFS
ncbi:DUF4157 domain-containing protein [Shimia sp. R10_1]|uniref:eCIS core domain-containing protein n=1 Tax=Shimia sp. R10_1 TaxID=2821095 RepID=UPI001AD9DFAD|nr:DUF4157 domain-containing protein [Shimia sp. R10_1]MBO9474750.1 DUF4157 domain-containing protein [Shimia sp. R10_1]